MKGAPVPIPFAVINADGTARAALASQLADPRLILFHHQADGATDAARCLCCAGETDMARRLETLLRDIDNGRAARPEAVLLLMDAGGDPAIPLGHIQRHPYFSRRFSPALALAAGPDNAAATDADRAIDTATASVEEILATLRSGSDRPAALRERLYRAAMGTRTPR